MLRTHRPARIGVRGKLILGSVASLTVLGSILTLFLSAREETLLERRSHAQMRELGQTLASFTAAGLDFQDSSAVAEVLATARRLQEIDGAFVYDASGHLFASNRIADSDRTPSAPDSLERPVRTTTLLSERHADRVWVPIETNEHQVGTLLLVATKTLRSNEVRHEQASVLSIVAVGLILASILASIFGGLLTRPLVELERATVAIAGGDFTRRVIVASTDELGRLAAAFNRMAETLQTTTTSRDALETEVRERNRALEEARDERQKAVDASRAKSEFLARMSHEIRTPMNGVLGMTELTLETQLEPMQRENLITVRDSGLHLLAVINDILDYSKIDAGKLILELAPTDLGELIERLHRAHLVSADARGIRLTCEIGPGIKGFYSCDPVRLRQILTNLLGNSIKFTSQGEVGLRVARVLRVPPPSADPSESRIRFEVEDTGIGIQPDQTERIFEAFAQGDGSTTRRYGGTGLGLPIAGDLVRQMGGEIRVESEVGRGSQFWFELDLASVAPVADDLSSESGAPVASPAFAGRSGAAAARGTAPPDDGAAPFRPLRVLVAEDNPVNRRVLELMLQRAGHEVVLVPDGRAAVAAWAGGPFDLILMDWADAGDERLGGGGRDPSPGIGYTHSDRRCHRQRDGRRSRELRGGRNGRLQLDGGGTTQPQLRRQLSRRPLRRRQLPRPLQRAFRR